MPSPLPRPALRRLRCPHLALALAAASSLGACTPTSALRAEIREVGGDMQAARQQGALRCAPRELALAEANHRFALIELDEGSLGRARTHLRVASLHAQAALARVSGRRCGGAQPAASGPSAMAPAASTAPPASTSLAAPTPTTPVLR